MKTRAQEVEELVEKTYCSLYADILLRKYCSSPDEYTAWAEIHDKHLEEYVQIRIEKALLEMKGAK